MTSVPVDPAANARACRMVRAFLMTWFAGLAVMLIAAILVNPWNSFGPVGITRNLRSRQAKLDAVAALPAAERPQVVVLGSSNTMCLQPPTIERLLGKRAFNLGVFWGKIEDCHCILRWTIEELGHRPELAIIGLDTWSLARSVDDHPMFPGSCRDLLTTPTLIRLHPDHAPMRELWARFVDSFSVGILKEYYHLARATLRGAPVQRQASPGMVQSGMFRADGVRIAYGDVYRGGEVNIFEDVEAGRYPITELLHERCTPERLHELTHFNTYRQGGFSPLRLRYLDDLLALCEANGVRVAFVMLPVHPEFRRALFEHTDYRQDLARLQERLRELQRTHPCIAAVVDASVLESFGGDPNGYYDEIHPSVGNADRILARIAEALGR